MANKKILKLIALKLSLLSKDDSAWILARMNPSIVPTIKVIVDELRKESFMLNKHLITNIIPLIDKKIINEITESKARPANTNSSIYENNHLLSDPNELLNNIDTLYLALANKMTEKKFHFNLNALEKNKAKEINAMIGAENIPLSIHVQNQLMAILKEKLPYMQNQNHG